jgi:hypothetical protein
LHQRMPSEPALLLQDAKRTGYTRWLLALESMGHPPEQSPRKSKSPAHFWTKAHGQAFAHNPEHDPSGFVSQQPFLRVGTLSGAATLAFYKLMPPL